MFFRLGPVGHKECQPEPQQTLIDNGWSQTGAAIVEGAPKCYRLAAYGPDETLSFEEWPHEIV